MRGIGVVIVLLCFIADYVAFKQKGTKWLDNWDNENLKLPTTEFIEQAKVGLLFYQFPIVYMRNVPSSINQSNWNIPQIENNVTKKIILRSLERH